MTARKSSVRVEDVNLPDDYNPASDAEYDEKGSPEVETPVAMAGHHQQRAMAAALRDHGITTDAAVYDFLSAFLGREVSSRKELTTVEAAKVIRDCIDNPPKVGPTAEQWAALAAPFPPDQIEKLPKAGMLLDYVGHAGITMRLNDVVSPAGWSWEPVAWNPDGTPNTAREFWIRLTVLGVTKYGVGDGYGNSGKQAVGDALRNAAMRFGIGTYLWSKSEAALAMKQATDDHTSPQDRYQPYPTGHDAPPPTAPPIDDLSDLGTADLLLIVGDYADSSDLTFYDFTAKWRKELGDLSVDALDDLPPETVAAYVRRVRHHLAQTGAQG